MRLRGFYRSCSFSRLKIAVVLQLRKKNSSVLVTSQLDDEKITFGNVDGAGFNLDALE